jgi:Dyp-type peroxidase family
MNSDELMQFQPNVLRPCPQAYVARMFLYRFEGKPQDARSWLSTVTSRLYEVSDDSRVWLNVALTHGGLAALGASAHELADFPAAFRDGMAKRRNLLGDPVATEWPADPHLPIHAMLLVLVRADDATLLQQLKDSGETAQARRDLPPVSTTLSKTLQAVLDRACETLSPGITAANGLKLMRHPRDLHHPLIDRAAAAGPRYATVEYFGFQDGLSQPPSCVDAAGSPAQWHDDDSRPNGQIVLGADAPNSLLARGSFLVVRQLKQDVTGFWKFLSSVDPDNPDAIAELLVGRRKDGWPLGSDEPRNTPFLPQNPPPAFTPQAGAQPPVCPFQSHVRRVNPRIEPASARGSNPVLLRRGMSYYDAEEKTHGLMFMAYNADLEAQFEFIQANWIRGANHVGGLSSHRDPLAAAASASTLADPTFVARLPNGSGELNVPSYVTFCGGEYFFMPTRNALERLATPPAERPAPTLAQALSAINEPQLAREFWTRVPNEGLRIEGFVFVKQPRLVTTLLADDNPSVSFSVREYGRRLRALGVPFMLGMDTDTHEYRAEQPFARVIPTTPAETQRVWQEAERATKTYLESAKYQAALQLPLFPQQKPEIDSGQLAAFVLSAVWGELYDLPGPSRGSLLPWGKEITDAVFRVGVSDVKYGLARQTAKDLKTYVLREIVAARAQNRRLNPSSPSALPDSHPGLSQLLFNFGGLDDDDTARILSGILVGSLTAVAGTFVPGLATYAALCRVQHRPLSIAEDAKRLGSTEPWPYYRAMVALPLQATESGGPDYLYRSYLGQEPKHFDTHIPIMPGDTVVTWIGGASAAKPEAGGDPDRRFGAGSHMCPGREMGKAIIEGIGYALGAVELAASDDSGRKFTF